MTKKLKLFDLVSIGVGSVIGAGIFSMLSTGISMTGRSIAPALAIAMMVVTLQQLRSIFTASMFALDGGMYSQQALVLPPLFTGMTSVIFVLSNLSFSIFGISIADYLSQLIPALAPFKKPLAVVILTLFFLVSIKGTGFLAKVQNVMAVCMYLALIIFIGFGLTKVVPGGFEGEAYFIGGPVMFLMSVAIMSFTCNGATNIINLSSDSENPTKNVPLSILITVVICSALYFLLGFVASGVMPYAQASQTNLGGIAQSILPRPLYLFFILGGAIFALATSLLGGISAISAPIVAGAVDGWLPKPFTKKMNVMIMMYVVSVVPALFGFSLDTIVSFILVPGMILGAMSNILSLKLPKKFPEAWNKCAMKCPYPVYVFLMILSTAANLAIAFLSLMGLNLMGILGNLGLTIFLFVFAKYRLSKGYVHMTSIEGVK